MTEDWDEDTLKDIVSEETIVIGPIAEMRRKKEIINNTFRISRENYDKSSNEQVEAWFTKFDDVIIDDSKEPYKEPLTKKQMAMKIANMINFENIDKGITKFNKGVDQFSKMVAAKPTKKKYQPKRINSAKKNIRYEKDHSLDNILGKPKVNFWGEPVSFFGKKMKI